MIYMRYGLLSYRNTCKDIEYAKKFNIDHVEIDLTRIKLKEIEDNVKQLKKCDKSLSLHLPWDYSLNPQNSNQKQDLKYVNKVIKIVNKINAEYIVMHLGYYETRKRDYYLNNTINFLKKILDFEFNSYLLIENLKPKSQISNKIFLGGQINDFTKIFNRTNDKRLKMCFDIGHAAYSWDVYESFKHFEEKIYAVHVHDNNGEKDHLQIGDGQIDWYKMTKLIKNAKIQGPLIFEIFDIPVYKSIEQFKYYLN